MDSVNKLSERPNTKHTVSVDERGVVFLDGKQVARGTRGNLVCSICLVGSRSIEFLERHVQSVHNGVRSFQCKLCTASYDNQKVVHAHIHEFHLRNYKWECAACGKRFVAQNRLKAHLATHGEKVFKCRHCSTRFKTKGSAVDHARKMHLRTRFHCSRSGCTIRFLTEAERRAHINVMHEGLIKGYKCDLCWKSYLTNEALQHHYGLVHPNSLECQLCPWPETFNRNDEAANHLRERHWHCEEDDEWLLKIATENAPTNPNAPWANSSGSLAAMTRVRPST